jgi:beta-ureidopropionase / N-carbamoyl-L-amino-acid hydrolase
MDERTLRQRFTRSFDALAAIGRADDGWYRLAWTEEDTRARAWFTAEAQERGLALEEDRNANLWAWWGGPGPDAVVTGSHLDTVPGGGAHDGALGIVSAFAAIDLLKARGVRPRRPVAVAAFTDEEGGRFGTPCLGSGLLLGHYDPVDVLARRDPDGVSLADAAAARGKAPGEFGPAPEVVARIGVVVELHVEQGRGLADLGSPVALGTRIWPHGRWRADIRGEANHAGTTRLTDRRDPVLVLGEAARTARARADAHDAVATIGRVVVVPNAANGVAARARAWLDARAADDRTLDALVAEWSEDLRAAAGTEGCAVSITAESRSAAVDFDDALLDRMARTLGDPPRLPTAAGHDAATLAAAVPTGMLFVRNPTGASHTPSESATTEDCLAGVEALARVLEDLACR